MFCKDGDGMNAYGNRISADKIIAIGTSKTVYQDGDIALKVFEKNYPKTGVLKEALNYACAEETGLPVPEFLEVMKFEGQWTILTQHVKGPTLQKLMEESPQKRSGYLNLLIKLQLKIHTKKSVMLEPIHDRFHRGIHNCCLDASMRRTLHDKLNRLSQDEAPENRFKICHGNFNPSNVIISRGQSPYIVDWACACQGNAAADAANTYLYFWLKDGEEPAEDYLNTYCQISHTRKDEILEWIPIAAAAGLPKKNEEDKARLIEGWLKPPGTAKKALKLKITVCIGSSCHIKGSRHVIRKLQNLISGYGLQSKIELNGAFCMGKCQHGVNVLADGRHYSVSADTVHDFFENKILPRFREEVKK